MIFGEVLGRVLELRREEAVQTTATGKRIGVELFRINFGLTFEKQMPEVLVPTHFKSFRENK